MFDDWQKVLQYGVAEWIDAAIANKYGPPGGDPVINTESQATGQPVPVGQGGSDLPVAWVVGAGAVVVVVVVLVILATRR